VSGQELARSFYLERVRPLLDGVDHAAGLLGEGSEILGYDDEISTDHDFGPRVQIFTDSPVPGLPEGTVVTTAAAFFTDRLGVDPAAGLTLADWLLTPSQRLATLTAGAVFHDPAGELARRRAALAWYPDDVWRYVLAAQWLRIGQEEAFVGRTGGTGDDLGSSVVAARLVRDLIRLAFLVERRWAPYSKWLGRGFAGLELASTVGPHLAAAVAARDWREREAAICAAGRLLGDATNRLGLAVEVDPAPRPFYTRDIQVVAADRFTMALAEAVTDPEVRALLARLGKRREDIYVIPGTIDQAVDSVDVIRSPASCRAVATVLGLAAPVG